MMQMVSAPAGSAAPAAAVMALLRDAACRPRTGRRGPPPRATRSGSAMTVSPGGDGDAGKLGVRGLLHGPRPERRQVEAPVLRRFRRLDQHARCRSGILIRPSARSAAIRSSMWSVPSAASTASTRLSATTTACPTSNGAIAAISSNPRAMSCVVGVGRLDRGRAVPRRPEFPAPARARRSGGSPCSSNDPGNARQQLVVAAPEDADGPRQQAQRQPVESQFVDRGPHGVADHDDVAAAFLAGEPAESPGAARGATSGDGSARRPTDRPSHGSGTDTTGRPPRSTASATVNGRLPPPQMIATGSPLGLRRCAAHGSASAAASADLRSAPPSSTADDPTRADEIDDLPDQRMRRRIPARRSGSRSLECRLAVEQHPIGAPTRA